MSLKTSAHTPSVSAAAVKAKTGKEWSAWFSTLDKAGARKLTHQEIAAILNTRLGVPGWWSQMITVEYELSRGLRERHQTSDGYSVSVTKTIGASLSQLYAATVDSERRKKWFPRGAFKPSSQTKHKYLNGEWKGSRLNIGFYAKGEAKAQIAIQVNKLKAKAEVDREREQWKAALAKLQASLEG